MKLEPLASHRHHFPVGKPIPYAIFDAAGRLLLARGHTLPSAEQLENLLERDATVDLREVDGAVKRIVQARPEELPAFWDESMDALGRVLRAQPHADFVNALDQAARPLVALIERDPDLAILQVVRFDATGAASRYASRHAVHTATAACLAASRLGWDEARSRCVLRASLTMNLAMADLQNRLVNQVTPVTPLQRAEIASHPERSAQMLETVGVTDAAWLDAVRQHHEQAGGSGYPRGLARIDEAALLVQRADVFTAKFSPRVSRPAVAADHAARLQYQADQGGPMTAALIKEFGLYPPGCAVRLKSGETGVVMRRGAGANTPVVAVLTDRGGDALLAPARRDTSRPEHAIVAVLPMAALKVRIGLEKLVACMAG